MAPPVSSEAAAELRGLHWRAEARLVIRCSRALILAHFDTAERCPAEQGRAVLGAQREFLDQRRLEEGVAAPLDWYRYEELWRRPRGEPGKAGPSLRWEGDRLCVLATRKSGAEWLASRPSVFWMLSELLGGSLPDALLRDLHRADLRERYGLDDSADFAEFVEGWVKRFTLIGSLGCKRLRLLDPSQMRYRAGWSEALLEGLEHLAVLEYDPGDPSGYLICRKTDSAGLRACLFARSTGTAGLDRLMYGGLVPGTQELALVISGTPGIGKTTLALAMAVQAALRGGACFYFAFQQTREAIGRQLAHFYRGCKDLYSRPEEFPERPGTEGDGVLLITRVVTTPVATLREGVSKVATPERRQRYSEGLVVFDSISAVEEHGELQAEWREFVATTAAELRQRGYTVVFVLERRSSAEVFHPEDFVADVSLRLSLSSPGDIPYAFRTLEIAKSRFQPSNRGAHPYQILEGKGLAVYPSSAAVLTVRRSRETRLVYGEGGQVDPGVEGFARHLGGERYDPGRRPASVPWWQHGSVTALIGPRGTLKAPFAQAFFHATDQGQQAETCALSLHFADEYHSYQPGLGPGSLRPSTAGLRYDFQRPGDRPGGLTYYLFRASYVPPGQVLEEVRAYVLEQRRQRRRIERAVIADAANIGRNFPALRNDPVFLPALCDLLTSHGVTVVLACSTRQEGAGDPELMEQIRSLADNILRFDRIFFGGRQVTTIQVERSATSGHDQGTYELRQDRERDGFKLSARPTLDLAVNLRPGPPRPAKVVILLEAGTALQQSHHQGILEQYEGIESYEVKVERHRAGLARHRLLPQARATENALYIVEFDAYQVPPPGGDQKPEPAVFEELTRFLPRPEQARRAEGVRSERVCPLTDLVYLPAPEGREPEKPKRIYSIPYFLNPSFLAVRKDFHDFVAESPEPAFKNIAKGLGDYSWEDLWRAGEEFLKWWSALPADSRQGPPPAHVFDYAAETEQTVTCVFLEILCALAGGPRELGRILKQLGNGLESRPSAFEKMVQAAAMLCRLLEFRRKPAPQQPAQGASLSAWEPGAVIWRHWYTTFRDTAGALKGGDCTAAPPWKLLRLPGNAWMNGDWHFGILTGSAGVRTGIEIILEQFVTRTNAMNLMIRGAGLSPFRTFYGKESPLPVAEVPPCWFKPYVDGERVISRNLLPGYAKYAPVLAFHLSAILDAAEAHKEAPPGALEAFVRDRLEYMLGLIRKSPVELSAS